MKRKQNLSFLALIVALMCSSLLGSVAAAAPPKAAGSSATNQTSVPFSEFFQLSFPIARHSITYSSNVDHYSPNYTYNDDYIRPYTGEYAAAVRVRAACGYTNSRQYCYQGHSGLDIPVASGTPVYAAHAGYVFAAGWSTHGYGYYVVIQDQTHPEFYTLYGHNQSNLQVQQGGYVTRGQLISYSDNSGSSTGPHLHFGTYMYSVQDAIGNVLDPYGWFSQYPNPIGSPVTDLKWAAGYPPTNASTDPVNWNEGTLIGNAYINKSRGVGNSYPTGNSSADPIEQWWANSYGSAGVPTGAEYYDPAHGNCQDFEGGTYCTDGSYRTVIVGGGAFTDTPLTDWAHRYIGWAHREGVMNGYNDTTHCGNASPCFLPDSYISRAEFAVTMVNGFNLTPHTSGGPHYCDVATGHWAYSAIETLYNDNIMRGQPGTSCGYSNLYFNPATNIKRGELSRVIVTFAQYKGWISGIDTTGGPDYCDVPNTGTSACPQNGYQMWYGYVETLYNNGIIQWRDESRGAGNGGLFRPNLFATRAQIAMFFHELVYAPSVYGH